MKTYVCFLILIIIFLPNNILKAQSIDTASKYFQMEKYEIAAVEYEKVAREIKDNFPKKKESYKKEEIDRYGYALIMAASCYYKIENFDKAEELFLLCNFIYEETNYKASFFYSMSCKGLGKLYTEKGKINKAENFIREEKNINSKIFGKKNYFYIESCIDNAMICKKKGKYEEAAKLLLEAKEAFEFQGIKNKAYYDCCNQLVILYIYLNRFNKAEKLLNIIDPENRITPLNQIDSEISKVNTMALYYESIGDYGYSEKILVNLKERVLYNLGKNDISYPKICLNLGVIYLTQHKFTQAKANLYEALRIFKKLEGDSSHGYAAVCTSLGEIYRKEMNYEKAEEFYIKAKNIFELFGKENSDFATACRNLGALYYNKGNFTESKKESNLLYRRAVTLNIEAKKIRKALFGTNSLDYATICHALAGNYRALGDYKNANKNYIEANSIINKLSLESAKFMSIGEREKYLKNKINYYFDIYYSFFLMRKKECDKRTDIIYDNVLKIKNQLLNSAINVRETIIRSENPQLHNRYKEMNRIGLILSKKNTKMSDVNNENIRLLEKKYIELEKELIDNSQAYNHLERFSKVTWKDIQNSLKHNEAAIEFIHFSFYNDKHRTDSVKYYGLIIKKDLKQPKAIYLFEENELSNLLKKRKDVKEDFTFVTKLYSSKKLDSLIWKPIESTLKKDNINTLFISPSGLLHKISFSAIIPEKIELTYMLSTASILTKEKNKVQIDNIVAFGGINYDKTNSKLQEKTRIIQEKSKLKKGGNLYPWKYLPTSKVEIGSISKLFTEREVPVKEYRDSFATEKKFKELSNQSPDIIHISTHGFYNPLPIYTYPGNIQKKEDYIGPDNFFYKDNPLMRSGLIFAGANKFWSNDPSFLIEEDDGILTADELSYLNFYNTKLVVTSACQTALGDIDDEEGVFGLQRGFKIAGVKNLINTLWKVEPEYTRDFMISFYSKIFIKKTIHEAFHATQIEMKKQKSPYFWAAFILIE